MDIVLIAAIGENGELGYQNELLWRLPGDLPRFKQLTIGHPVVMGRRTFDSIGRPLSERHNIILSANKDWQADGVTLVNSPEQALAAANNRDKAFIIGGGQIYRLFLPFATHLELTEVADTPLADVYFPNFSNTDFKETARIHNTENQPAFDYVSYRRV